MPLAKHKLLMVYGLMVFPFISLLLCQVLNNSLRYNNDYVGVTYTGHHMFIIHVEMNKHYHKDR